MARSELLEKPKSQITIDRKTESVLIRNLSVNDREVFKVILDQDEIERPEFVKRALKVGVIALRDVLVAEKMDYVKSEFDSLCIELDKIFGKELGKEGMKGELERVFGEKGELHLCLEKLFGADGKLSRDILDMNNSKSPIGQLRKTIEAYFVGKDSQMYGMLDPNSQDSPMARLRTELMQKLEKIEKDVATYMGRKEVVDNAPQKGFDFEDDLEKFLIRLSKPFGDMVERTGTEKGKLGNLKGDFVVTLNDQSIKGKAPRIIIEAKTMKSVRLTPKSLLGELRDAMQNREASFAIAVTDSVITEAIGCYHEVEGDKIICCFSDNGLPLEVAYRMARTYILMKMRQEPHHEIDTAKICSIANKITNDLCTLKSIKTSLTGIGKAANKITEDVNEVEKNIRESLNDLQETLRQGTAKG